MPGRLQGKVALITGAARGQGAAEAERFVAEGAKVVLTDVLDEGEKVAGELGDAAVFVHHDVTDAAEWQRAIATATDRFGRLDVLVNNAGVYVGGAPIASLAEATFRRVLDVNLVGPFLGIQAAVPAMSNGGSIINIASIAGLSGFPTAAAYSSSKFGLRGLTRVAALELGPLGIRVNAILPGVIRTPMVDEMLAAREESIAAALPVGHIGEPSDIADVALWLASDESRFVTGTDVVADGGSTAGTFRRDPPR
jgi:3alpha(or 20beta)-hydroxysteroid dehydrogenase